MVNLGKERVGSSFSQRVFKAVKKILLALKVVLQESVSTETIL
jgi:hypothetical protein